MNLLKQFNFHSTSTENSFEFHEILCHISSKKFSHNLAQLLAFRSEKVKSRSRVRLSETLWTVAHQALVPGILQARVLEWVTISLSRGIFPTQGPSPGLLRCRQMLYYLSRQGSDIIRSEVRSEAVAIYVKKLV